MNLAFGLFGYNVVGSFYTCEICEMFVYKHSETVEHIKN